MLELANRLSQYKVEGLKSRPIASGKLVRVVGLTLEATGCKAPIGSLCLVETMSGQMEAEVVGFSGDNLFLMPSEQITGILPGARVTPVTSESGIPVGMELLGRVIDGVGNPLDGLGPIYTEQRASFNAEPINPLARKPISEPLDVGLKAINGLLTVGKGQRIGLFAGSGVGKSVTLGMMTRGTTAQVVVVGLIGERGREVQEFIESTLGEEGLARSVVVVATSDESPLLRVRASLLATAIAEYFRDERECDVLLAMDSLTRFAQAQRQVGLARGEQPAMRGYPPSVFAMLPILVERAGAISGGGSITGLYTVLVEADDMSEPVSDAAQSVLDGHIVLCPDRAARGRYPAVDSIESISRVADRVTDENHRAARRELRMLLSALRDVEELVSIGAYVKGTDPLTDTALELQDRIESFLGQEPRESGDYPETCRTLVELATEAIRMRQRRIKAVPAGVAPVREGST